MRACGPRLSTGCNTHCTQAPFSSLHRALPYLHPFCESVTSEGRTRSRSPQAPPCCGLAVQHISMAAGSAVVGAVRQKPRFIPLYRRSYCGD